ncbi:Bromodomain-containing protein, partial [Syncephalis pseudoplumigaleata]
DVHNVFAQPVSIDDVPDYLTIIKEPMDFGTIRKKIDACAYRTLDEFEAKEGCGTSTELMIWWQYDIRLVYTNATVYNKPITYYYKLAKRLQYATSPLLRDM